MTRWIWSFTLIELLIVIAIMAILISMLVPALSAAKDTARSITCVGNLRQCGVAITSYASDNRLYAPPGEIPGLTNWVSILKQGGYFGPSGAAARKTVLCPNAAPETWTNDSYVYGMAAKYIGWAYIIDLNSIRTPSLREMLIDSWHNGPLVQRQSNYVTRALDSGYAKPQFRHKRQANACFADGHAMALVPSSTLLDAASTNTLAGIYGSTITFR